MENNKVKSDDNSVSIEFIQDFITASTGVINLSYENFRKNFYTQMSTDSTNYAAKQESLGKVDENKNETMKDRKLKVCIVTAQTRWRSKFEIELLGI
ncbi:hypothetical protein [Neisseria polysaccharea]|uniref:hypothetical protein n=1 Tax=Neisseria polysaccharea TaxID=489 RepID=UPI0027E1A5EE|nr:hypothetical protein [Neisseria polysaccharea]